MPTPAFSLAVENFSVAVKLAGGRKWVAEDSEAEKVLHLNSAEDFLGLSLDCINLAFQTFDDSTRFSSLLKVSIRDIILRDKVSLSFQYDYLIKHVSCLRPRRDLSCVS
jgi:hypothetical protein